MSIEQIEGLVVATAAMGLGVVVLVVDPTRQPEPIKSWLARMSRFRRAVGVVCILVGLACAAAAATGNW